MIDNIIYNIFKTHEYTLTPLDKGISNQNFKLFVNEETYIVRVPYEDNAHIFDRENEYSILDQVKDLDVPTIYFDKNTGIKITKFINHLYEYEECPYSDKIERCAKLLKQLHTIPAPNFAFQPVETLLSYKEKVKQPMFDLTQYETIIEDVSKITYEPHLCHNDIVSGNILFGEARDYLIDYEYAGSNDPLFDVMSFISENNINDVSERERFYKVYFDEINDDIRHELYLWEMFHNLLWCYWAMALYETRKEAIYKQIANDKYQALKRMKV